MTNIAAHVFSTVNLLLPPRTLEAASTASKFYRNLHARLMFAIGLTNISLIIIMCKSSNLHDSCNTSVHGR